MKLARLRRNPAVPVATALVASAFVATLIACSSADDVAGVAAGGRPDAAQPGSTGAAAGADSGGAGAPAPGMSDAGDASDVVPDGAARGDAGGDAGGCGALASATLFTCTPDGKSRARCAGGTSLVEEACPNGCLRSAKGQPDVCMGTTDPWVCTGSYGTKKAQNGDYDLTAFGCWKDAAGAEHTDPGDNCIPSCLAEAQAAGLCASGDTGKACEERVNWYTADAARFGCLARVRITNPANGKSVVAVALDFGPACSVESSVSKAVLDASGRVDRALFGADQGASDRALVHVVEVDESTPLGPVP